MAAFRFFLVLCLALSTTSAWSVQQRPQSKPQNKERVDEGFTDVNQWVEIARDKTSSRRAEAIRVLARIKRDGLTVNQWIEIARDKTSSCRAEAIHVLAEIEPPAKAAIPTLIEALKDKDKSVGFYASSALRSMGRRRDRPTAH
jgi:hypothetical protein